MNDKTFINFLQRNSLTGERGYATIDRRSSVRLLSDWHG